jgi:isoprenylcysteine carboxyl methyltransferase (ICMT) family protein YpbQ
LLVVAEIAVLPLAFGAVAIAATFSALNLMLIARRIRIEERVLAPRRGV